MLNFVVIDVERTTENAKYIIVERFQSDCKYSAPPNNTYCRLGNFTQEYIQVFYKNQNITLYIDSTELTMKASCF